MPSPHPPPSHLQVVHGQLVLLVYARKAGPRKALAPAALVNVGHDGGAEDGGATPEALLVRLGPHAAVHRKVGISRGGGWEGWRGGKEGRRVRGEVRGEGTACLQGPQGGASSPKVRLQRGQCRSPEGRPTGLRSLSSVVRQMGQTRSKVVSDEPPAAVEAADVAPASAAPGVPCTDCWAAA